MSLRDLIDLVENGNVESVGRFLSSHQINLNQATDAVGGTPLTMACTSGNLDMIKLLLEEGAEVDFHAANFSSALTRAVKGGNVAVVKLLIEHGARVDLTMNKKSSLEIACSEGVEMVKAILGDIDISTVSEFPSCQGVASHAMKWKFSYLNSPVNAAAKYGQVELVKWFLEQHLEVPFGALLFAISKTKTDMVNLLLEHGADVNATGDGGWSALMLACLYGCSSIVKMLLERDAKINLLSEAKEYALKVAARRTHVEVVKLLLERGAHVDLKGGGSAITAVVIACAGYHGDTEGGMFKTIATLLESGANVNLPDEDGHTAFCTAVQRGSDVTVKQLLNSGGLIETISWNTLPCMYYKEGIEHKVLKVLLEAGLEIDKRYENGNTLLMAPGVGVNTLKQLIAKKADVNLQNNDGVYALLNAIRSGNYDIAEILLENGARIDLLAHNGESASGILLANSLDPWFSSDMTRYPKIRKFLSESQNKLASPAKSLQLKNDSPGEDMDFEGPGITLANDTVLSDPTDSLSPERSGDRNKTEGQHDDDCEKKSQQEFICEVKEAIVENKVLDRKLAHSIFIGPPGSGKSSLMARLLHRARKAFSSSTGVSDSIVIVDIDSDSTTTFHAATVTGPNTWQEVDYDISLVKQMNTGSVTTSPPEQVQPKLSEERNTLTPSSKSSVPESEHSKAEPVPIQRVVTPSTIKLSDSEIREMINAVIKKCGGFQKFQHSFSKSFSLYLRDTGGHMAFQEMLSVLILGPSIFVFVFRTDVDMKSKFHVEYRVNAGTSLNCTTSSITTEEALLQCLASVYAMDTTSKAGVKTHKPLVFIVGTHKDKLGSAADDKIAELNEHLDSLIDSNSCFQDLVQYADREKGQVMFTVDNTCTSDEDFMLIRSKIYSLVSERAEFTIDYPVSYLMFALELQHEKRSVLSLDECKAIAAKYGIEGDQVSHLLHFLHFRVGVIQYFDVEGLVMTKPQVLFSKVTQLIRTTFSRKSLSSREVREFQKGIFTASLIKMVVGESGIDSEKFLKLLNRLHIITPFTTPVGDQEEKYFIPCVLNHVQESMLDDVHTDILPLAVRFKCEHCPKGLFGVLVTQLMTPEETGSSTSFIEFTLMQDEIFRDQVSFEVHSQFADQDEMCLKILPSHLEIRLFPALCEERDSSINDVCCALRLLVESAIRRSLDYLHYDAKKVDLLMCFKCDSCQEFHQVKRGMKAHKIHCNKFRATHRIPQPGRFWYNEGIVLARIPSVSTDGRELMRTSSHAALAFPQAPSTRAVRVSVDDLATITEKLTPYSHKWRRIGQGLGFTTNELINIEAQPTLLLGAPSSYLSTMLSDWWQWAPGDARGSKDYATLESLRRAVDRAGLGRIAQELCMEPHCQQQAPLVAVAAAALSIIYILYHDIST